MNVGCVAERHRGTGVAPAVVVVVTRATIGTRMSPARLLHVEPLEPANELFLSGCGHAVEGVGKVRIRWSTGDPGSNLLCEDAHKKTEHPAYWCKQGGPMGGDEGPEEVPDTRGQGAKREAKRGSKQQPDGFAVENHQQIPEEEERQHDYLGQHTPKHMKTERP